MPYHCPTLGSVNQFTLSRPAGSLIADSAHMAQIATLSVSFEPFGGNRADSA
jgi:hypothetical protein